MVCLAPSTCSLQSTRIGQDETLGEPQQHNSDSVSIHTLDDNSLLNTFYLYRLAIFEEDEGHLAGGVDWIHEQWWYKLVHVCQRWRNLVLGSPSYLHLHLFCAYGIPVADMLAHSPHFPIAIDYVLSDGEIAVEMEERIFLALGQRDRVRRVRLRGPDLNLQKFIVAIDGEYPALEYLILKPPMKDDFDDDEDTDEDTALMLPETLQAPHLRHLELRGFALPIGSRLLTTAVGLVTLILHVGDPSTYIQPNTLLQWISSMPQLETLLITFLYPTNNRAVEGQLTHTRVTLPNLRWFGFQGVDNYMEAVVRRIIAPRLEKLSIQFFKETTYSVPQLLQFMNTSKILKFDSAVLEFYRDAVYVKVYPHGGAETFGFSVDIRLEGLETQVSSMAQIFNSLSQIFSTVKHLALIQWSHWYSWSSSEEHDEVHRTECLKLLRSFNNAKTLHVNGEELVENLTRFLRPDDGELSLELLPELQELTYSGSGDTVDPSSAFIIARQSSGRPVTLSLLLNEVL